VLLNRCGTIAGRRRNATACANPRGATPPVIDEAAAAKARELGLNMCIA